MIEKPILFSAPMIRAILEGRKTMTRRVVDPDLWDCLEDGRPSTAQYIETDDTPMGGVPAIRFCPHGVPGDRLWVRENFYVQPDIWAQHHDKQPIHYAASTRREEVEDYVCKPSIHMPRWASRMTLDLSAVRVERLHDITEADAIAEGCDHKTQYLNGTVFEGTPSCRNDYANLWNDINKKRGFGWDMNPWVWVETFIKVTP